jgi:hypothetical protein
LWQGTCKVSVWNARDLQGFGLGDEGPAGFAFEKHKGPARLAICIHTQIALFVIFYTHTICIINTNAIVIWC